jgi:hypothetical protein
MTIRIVTLLIVLGGIRPAIQAQTPFRVDSDRPAIVYLLDQKMATCIVRSLNRDRLYVSSNGRNWYLPADQIVAFRFTDTRPHEMVIQRAGDFASCETETLRKLVSAKVTRWEEARVDLRIDPATGIVVENGATPIPPIDRFRDAYPQPRRVASPLNFRASPGADESLFVGYLLMDTFREWPAMFQTDEDDTPTAVNVAWYTSRRAIIQTVQKRLVESGQSPEILAQVRRTLAQFDRTANLLSRLDIPTPDYGDSAVKAAMESGIEAIAKAVTDRVSAPPRFPSMTTSLSGKSSVAAPKVGLSSVSGARGMTFSPKGAMSGAGRAGLEMLVAVGVELGYEFAMHKYRQWQAREELRKQVREHRDSLAETATSVKNEMVRLAGTKPGWNSGDVDFRDRATRPKDAIAALKRSTGTREEFFDALKWVPAANEYAIYRVSLLQRALAELPDLPPDAGPRGEGSEGRKQLPYWEGADALCRFESFPGGVDFVLRWAGALAAAGYPEEAFAKLRSVGTDRLDEIGPRGAMAAATMYASVGNRADSLVWLTRSARAGQIDFEAVVSGPLWRTVRVVEFDRLLALFEPKGRYDATYARRLFGYQTNPDRIRLVNLSEITLTNVALELTLSDGEKTSTKTLKVDRLDYGYQMTWEPELGLDSGIRIVSGTMASEQSSLSVRLRSNRPGDREFRDPLDRLEGDVGRVADELMDRTRTEARLRKSIAVDDEKTAAKNKTIREMGPKLREGAKDFLVEKARKDADDAAEAKAHSRAFRDKNKENVFGEISTLEGGWGAFQTSEELGKGTVVRIYRPLAKQYVGRGTVTATVKTGELAVVAPLGGLQLSVDDLVVGGR